VSDWSIDKSRRLYNIAEWSEGYFDVAASGHLVARPFRDPGRGAVDLLELAESLARSGLSFPVLVRFTDILHDRVEALCRAFAEARAEHGYAGGYTAVYPIKVNQQRSVVEQVVRHGGARVGLEAGSKPELMAVLGLSADDGVIVCNGYKDREYIRRALIARRLGHRVFIVVEKLSELDEILAESRALGVAPLLGVRVRLASLGTSKWQNTGGEKSKFGLSATQFLHALRRLQESGLKDSLRLLHFHMGSQIANIRDIQRGMSEAVRHYGELRAMGFPVEWLDVGGGLGVDYEGTRSRSFCSMNYSMREYANAVVRGIRELCLEQSLPEPGLITEAGRAMVAHHAVLITQVTDVEMPLGTDGDPPAPAPDAPLILHDLWQGFRNEQQRPLLELYHDAAYWLSEAHSMYTHGLLSLQQRAQAEQLYTAICQHVRRTLEPGRRAHREALDQLDERLAVKYFCNFSLFQSLPDVWAIQQVFPVVPLHRLQEHPAERGVIEDLTCDSDGRIDHYVDQQGLSPTVALHPLRRGEDYLLGFFMIGAYQEILGDMHNLFGDTDAVNVELDADGGYRLVDPENGDTADRLLSYVHFRPEDLLRIYQAKIERAGLDAEESRRYLAELTAGLKGYTYLKR